MKPQGEDIASAIRDWIKEEIKNTTKAHHDLGKFFFGVSSSTMGIIVSLEKFTSDPKFDWKLIITLSLLFVSISIALFMVIPVMIRVKGDIDLYSLHEREARKVVFYSISWFTTWMLVISSGIFTIFS